MSDQQRSPQTRPTVELARHADLEPPRPGAALVNASVGPDGDAIAVWSSTAGQVRLTGRVTGGGASFPATSPGEPVPVVVTRHDPAARVAATIDALPLTFPQAQPLPGDRILLVGARAEHREADGPEHNALVYGADGRLVAGAVFGDGIEHVLASPSGQIWVGYFDEGVYGNFGWGGPGQPAPVGASGLVRFSPALQPDWHFPGGEEEPVTWIDDCYALNLDGETAWTCYYSGFPVVRIADGVARGWRGRVAGAHALIVAGNRLAQFGGYGADRDRVVLSTLGDGEVRPVAEYRLALPGGQDLPRGPGLVGRGADLHVFAGREWYRLGLDDLPS